MATGTLELPLLPADDALVQMQQVIDHSLDGAQYPRVLEAGCGALERVRFPPTARVTGLDLDENRLARNASLTERIVGNLEDCELPSQSFDAIVCWYVFEHLHNPIAAMARFARAVRVGGVVVLAFPNLMSPKGLVTKWTPFRFHVFFRRVIMRRRNAGTPGHGPYPTTLPFSMAPEALLQVADAMGLEVAFGAAHEDDKQTELRQRFGLTGRAWTVLKRFVRRSSGGQLDAEGTELVLVLRRT